MTSRRRPRPSPTPSLFDGVPISLPPVGNYATRSILSWLRSDPFAVELCRDWIDAIRLRCRRTREPILSALASHLTDAVPAAIRDEEPSPVYAEFLADAPDLEWPLLASALLEL
jgi:hypothetical protein